MTQPWMDGVVWLAVVTAVGVPLRFAIYLMFAGSYHRLAGVMARRGWRKLQPRRSTRQQITRELRWSFCTVVMYSLFSLAMLWAIPHGYTKVYLDWRAHSLAYFLASTLLLIGVHDVYFYAVHRLLHTPMLYRRVHYIHHLSTNPTAFSALNFHPVEALLDAAILPLFVLIVPIHPIAIVIWLLVMLLTNVEGHSGYEFRSASFGTHWLGRWLASSTLHNDHHRRGHGNYGLYTMTWDRLGRTHAQPVGPSSRARVGSW